MPRTRKPKLVTITRPIFEMYENKYEMMKTKHHLFSSNDPYKTMDYLVKKGDSILMSNASVKVDREGYILESEERHLFEVEQIEGFYGWIKSYRFETVQVIEEPKLKSEEPSTKTTKKRTTRKK